MVHVTLRNTGKASYSYNMNDFQLHDTGDSTNYQSGAIDLAISNTLLSYGKIAAGQTLAGDLAFEVPTGPHKYTLQWTPAFDATPLSVTITS